MRFRHASLSTFASLLAIAAFVTLRTDAAAQTDAATPAGGVVEEQSDAADSPGGERSPSVDADGEPVPEQYFLSKPEIYLEYVSQRPIGTGEDAGIGIGETVRLVGSSPDFLFIERNDVEDRILWTEIAGVIGEKRQWTFDNRVGTYAEFIDRLSRGKYATKYAMRTRDQVLQASRDRGLDAVEDEPAPERALAAPTQQPPVRVAAAPPAPALPAAPAQTNWALVLAGVVVVLFVLVVIRR